MKIDFLIPASPTDAFFSQLAMFRLSLNALGGPYRDARMVAVFGDDAYSTLPEVWRSHFAQIEVAWAEPEAFKNLSYSAQANRRFDLIRPDADLVVMCDADTLMIGPFFQDVFDVARDGSVGGVIAHYHFPWDSSSGDSTIDWNRISAHVFGSGIKLPFHYSLLGDDLPGACPFYVNLGFFMGSPESLRKFREGASAVRPSVRELIDNYFVDQVSVPFAVRKAQLTFSNLPMRYNFPNDPVADAKYPHELENVCLIHYLRTVNFDRHNIFVSKANFDAFLQLELSGSNHVFQSQVRHLTQGQYPF